MLHIDSSNNNTFKKIKKYRTKKYRDKDKRFLAEGTKFLDFDEIPEYILIDMRFLDMEFSGEDGEKSSAKENKENILKKLKKFENNNETTIISLSENLFSQLTSQENSQGVILVYKYEDKNISDIGDNIVVLDRVADPGNLGTIIRTVDAAGFSDIVLIKGSVDAYNEKVIRSTMGSIFNVNLYYIDEAELLEILKEREYKLISTVLHRESILYTNMKLSGKNAIVFGNEGSGVSENLIENSDEKVIIPIIGTAESLNVAMACGIIIYKVREILDLA